MSPDLDEQLCKENPTLFPSATLINGKMFWGFECNDGWFNLLRHAFALVTVRSEISPGCGSVIIEEVKEKNGTLRIYYRGGDDFVHGAINLAEAISVHVCEICGRNVKNRRMHYHFPRCDEHIDL